MARTALAKPARRGGQSLVEGPCRHRAGGGGRRRRGRHALALRGAAHPRALDTLDVDRRLVTSTPAELPLRLHALALLSPKTKLSLGCTGGVHSGLDVAKAVLSGAHVVQLASVLLERGPGHVAALRAELAGWLDAKGYKSSAEARGVLDVSSAPDAHAWERLNYIRMLDSWSQ